MLLLSALVAFEIWNVRSLSFSCFLLNAVFGCFHHFVFTLLLRTVTPVMSFSILVGLGLDYDIFLLSRVVEYRDAGFDIRQCIVQGVDKTGNIITAAGLIMAVAFSGLLMSSVGVLNQTSFFMVFAVLLDTFVIRMIMVPAIMGILGEYNWYPYGFLCHKKEDGQDFEGDLHHNYAVLSD